MASNDRQQSLDEWFPRTTPRLGVVVGGSLSKGLEIKLDIDADIEALAVGRYVVLTRPNSPRRFFSMVTDISLGATSSQIESNPPDMTNPFLRDVLKGTAAYGVLHVAPMLVLEEGVDQPQPVRTIPPHFTEVLQATEADINAVFGDEDQEHFYIGSPLELLDTQININLERLIERSVGVFGKSGTGKSYLTRILLSGSLARGTAVNLVFDMHNDYGWEIISERGRRDKGLKQLFPQKVAIFTLDPDSSRRRRVTPDFVVTMAFSDIDPEDLAMLKQTMDLSDSMIDAAYTLRRRWGHNWIQMLLDLMEPPELIDDLLAETAVNSASLSALTRRLERFHRFGFLVPQPEGDSVQAIMEYLEQGKSVILEFGRYGNALEAYILVANYLTRRIHERYVHRVEESLGDPAAEPPPLMITIEEAHKFLEPAIARQTIFGTIARELRKYKVTLLIVDQRPSGIDDEVMSQVGTRVTALLDNERDIAAVLTGVSGASGLREVLARLDTKQQAIVIGHAVPMPVVIQTRMYDEAFYKAMGAPLKGKGLSRAAKRGSKDLYGDEGFEGFD
jgi:DNA helicase HerA-like ATPase